MKTDIKTLQQKSTIRTDLGRKPPAVNDWHELSGKINYSLCNDYLFRAMLQTDPESLKYMISCLLDLPLETLSVQLLNPVELGEKIEDKDFILDLRVLVNDEILCNVEMQVWNQAYWEPRSLAYLCRTFSGQFPQGSRYTLPKPAIQVGILSFPFPNVNKFYSQHIMMEKDTHTIFSSLLQINVLSLLHLDKATTAERSSGLFTWAQFFRARTWEELKMLEKEDARIGAAAESVYKLICSETIRSQMEAREDYYLTMESYNEAIRERDKQLAEKEEQLAEKEEQLAEKEEQLAEKDKELAEKERQRAEMAAQIEQLRAQLEKR